jgi:hypothetical protein
LQLCEQKRFFEKDETIITYLSYLRGPKLPELEEEEEEEEEELPNQDKFPK